MKDTNCATPTFAESQKLEALGVTEHEHAQKLSPSSFEKRIRGAAYDQDNTICRCCHARASFTSLQFNLAVAAPEHMRCSHVALRLYYVRKTC